MARKVVIRPADGRAALAGNQPQRTFAAIGIGNPIMAGGAEKSARRPRFFARHGRPRYRPALLALGLGLALAYRRARRPWHLRYGATRAEAALPLPGDEVIPEPNYEVTWAGTIKAPPAQVWPWLVQMGGDRAGWYSYDRIANAGIRSADHILPELQHLQVGDVVPGAPGVKCGWRVASLEEGKSLVLALPDTYDSDLGRALKPIAADQSLPLLTRAFALREMEGGQTRFLMRYRSRHATSLLGMIFRLVGEPVEFVMTRKTLQGLKARVSSRWQGYYLARQARLMKEYDRAAKRVTKVLAPHFDFDKNVVRDIVRQTRREYLELLHEVPYIGGKKNPLTYNLVMSALFLAMYRVLLRYGKEPPEIGRIFYETAIKWYGSYPRFIMRLFGRLRFTGYYRRRLEKAAARSQARRYSADWVFTRVEGDGEKFDWGVDYTECGICKFYHSHDADAILPYLCLLDYPLSEASGLGLERTMTLAEGAPKCDFRFKRDRVTVLPPAAAAWSTR